MEQKNLFQDNFVIGLQKCYTDVDYHNYIMQVKNTKSNIILDCTNIQTCVNKLNDITEDLLWWVQLFNPSMILISNELPVLQQEHFPGITIKTF